MLVTTGTALGPVVLPILKAAGDIGGFFFVVGISLMAFISGYLALVPDYPLYVIFVSAFRTAIFGDGALTDVEEEGAVDEMTSDDTKFREEVMTFPVENIFMSLVAFALGVVLMNIFIAVLSINCERQYKLAWTSFMRARARGCESTLRVSVFDIHAPQSGTHTDTHKPHHLLVAVFPCFVGVPARNNCCDMSIVCETSRAKSLRDRRNLLREVVAVRLTFHASVRFREVVAGSDLQ